VPDWIECQPAEHEGGVVALLEGGESVGELMSDDGEQQHRQLQDKEL
jgi:hypothetical protein